jgi:hypothetical protein
MSAPPRDLDTHHLFSAPATREAWEARAKEIRERILFSCGLWPLPKKTPLRPTVTSTVELSDITIENVALETFPGFWLCGSLYKPKGAGPFPAIANMHGHWADGRLQREADVPKAPPAPGPRGAGKADLVALAASLARQGFVVFAYDMLGYNDTDQFVHRKLGASLDQWLWGVSELGVQTWNSIRVLDYLQSLPFVDKKKLGATGASGGGSQTFLLAAIDDRVQVSVPVNMVSAYMQGGCNCENAPGLRVGTDNVEVASVFAPKPQLFVSCTGDWTSKVPVEEGPAARKVYELYGKPENLQWVQFNYGHNYNVESREAMYAFFKKHLHGEEGEKEKPLELDPKQLRVKRPTGKSDTELLSDLKRKRSETALALRQKNDKKSRELLRKGLALALAVDAPEGKGKKGRADWIKIAAAPLDHDPKALWKDFFSCYNRTPLGEQVQTVLKNMVEANQAGVGSITLMGGIEVLLARAVAPEFCPGPTVVDLQGFAADDDAAYLERAYAPGLRGIGGLHTAALLANNKPLLLHNTQRKFRAENIPCRLEPEKLSDDEIRAWLKTVG